jgi:transposase InsO family protein
VARALGVSKRSAERRAAAEGWLCELRATQGGRQKLFELKHLPVEIRAAILRLRMPEIERLRPKSTRHTPECLQAAWTRYDRATAKLKAIAEYRMRGLFAVDELVCAGMGLGQARETVAKQLQSHKNRGSTAVVSLRRWSAIVRGAERSDWLALLLPHYNPHGTVKEIPAEAWDIFKSDYLRPEAPSAASCYDRLTRIAKARGWTIPGLRAFLRRLNRQISPQAQVLARLGAKAALAMYPAQQRDRSVFRALEAVNADGHTFDVFVKFPDGTVARPVVIPFQDLYSGKILSRRIGQTESADLARLSFHDLVTSFGIPKHVWLDNGRGFASKMLTGGTPTRYRFKVKAEDLDGVIVRLGSKVHWATPYHGQAKPIERAFRDWADRVAKHPAFDGAYTGNRPDSKPENYGSRAVEFDVFCRVVDEEIAAHNARPGRRTPVCGGRLSFDEVFSASYAQGPVRKATAEQLRHLLLATEAVTASARDGSITLAGNRYWCEALSPYAGQKVVARFDADNLHRGAVSVYTLSDEYLGTADCIAAVGFADTQAAREHGRARRQWLRASKQQLKAERRMSAAEVADQLPRGTTPPVPPARVIEPVFEQRKHAGEDFTAEDRQFDDWLKKGIEELKERFS